jgi:hypothetical protein
MTENREPDLWDICARRHGGDAQSVSANKVTDKSRDRSRIVAYLATVSDATCDEVEIALSMNHQTCSARFSDLKRANHIIPGNGKRPTRSGCLAQTWKLSDEKLFSPTEV